MLNRGIIVGNLGHAAQKQTTFLTLMVSIVLFATFCHADAQLRNDTLEDKQRVSQATAYLRTQGLNQLSALPHEAKEIFGWFSTSWHPLDALGDGDEAAPVVATKSSTPSSPRAFDLEVSNHHKGFLPTRDSFVIGSVFNQSVWPDKIGLIFKTYYGQNYFSLRGFYGGEVALNIAKHDDDHLPWGKIAVGYVGGDNNLTDNGRGIEIRGDVDLTNGFKFTTGVRQDVDGASNYAMLRWGATFGGNP